MESTLFIIKSDGLPSQQNILSHLTPYTILQQKHFTTTTVEQWQQHYIEHKDKPFYADLVDAMAGKPISVYILSAPNAISTLRTLIGTTDPVTAGENTLRRLYGTTRRQNAVHASDCPEAVLNEIAVWMA